MHSHQRREIAGRIRGLIVGQGSDLGATARRLRMDELRFRMTVDDESPYPTVDVIAAVVREYGVDPTWLLTGVYDPSTHRQSLETETVELPIAINALLKLAELPPQRFGTAH